MLVKNNGEILCGTTQEKEERKEQMKHGDW